MALVEERLTVFLLQDTKKIAPAKNGTNKDLIRIKCVVKWSNMNEKLNKFVEVKNYVADFLFTNVKTEISVEKLRRNIPGGTGRVGQVHKG